MNYSSLNYFFMMVYVRSLLVGLLVMISATTWAKDYSTTVPSPSFNGPMIQVLPQSENGVYRLAFLASEAQNLIIRVLDEDREELYRERVSGKQEFVKQFRLDQSPSGTYTFLVEGKGWKLSEAVDYIKAQPVSFDVDLVQKGESKKVLLHVEDASSEFVYVNITDAYGHQLFGDYIELNPNGYRSFNLDHIQSKQVYFNVYKDEVSIKEMIVLR